MEFQDRHAVGETEPIVDAENNYELLDAQETDTHTMFRFRRQFDTCDRVGDRVIEEGTMIVIWSYRADDPVNNIPLKHDHKGAKSLALRGPTEAEFVPTEDMKVWSLLRDDYVIPHNADTTYQCQIYKVPDEVLSERHQIVAVSIDSKEY